MSDDIVTRLRNWHDQRDTWKTLTEAADEIERLRELADSLAQHLQGYVCHCNMSKCKCGYDDIMDEYHEYRSKKEKYNEDQND